MNPRISLTATAHPDEDLMIVEICVDGQNIASCWRPDLTTSCSSTPTPAGGRGACRETCCRKPLRPQRAGWTPCWADLSVPRTEDVAVSAYEAANCQGSARTARGRVDDRPDR